MSHLRQFHLVLLRICAAVPSCIGRALGAEGVVQQRTTCLPPLSPTALSHSHTQHWGSSARGTQPSTGLTHSHVRHLLHLHHHLLLHYHLHHHTSPPPSPYRSLGSLYLYAIIFPARGGSAVELMQRLEPIKP